MLSHDGCVSSAESQTTGDRGHGRWQLSVGIASVRSPPASRREEGKHQVQSSEAGSKAGEAHLATDMAQDSEEV